MGVISHDSSLSTIIMPWHTTICQIDSSHTCFVAFNTRPLFKYKDAGKKRDVGDVWVWKTNQPQYDTVW